MARVMLSPTRLRKLLEPLGFVLRSANSTTKEILFVRASEVPRIFECLMICGQGKRGEAVYATTHVSGSSYQVNDDFIAVQDFELMYALESDKDRHWTVVHNREQATAWESKLAGLADKYCRQTTQLKGEELATRLQSVFAAVDRYGDVAGDMGPIFDAEYRYVNAVTEQEASIAERLASGAGYYNGSPDDVYLACLLLAQFAMTVEGDQSTIIDSKVRDTPQLRARIYLLADHVREMRQAFIERSGNAG